MEEPDLTLVSTSDISIAETDLANLTLEDNEAPSCFQVSAPKFCVHSLSLWKLESSLFVIFTQSRIIGEVQQVFMLPLSHWKHDLHVLMKLVF